MYTKIQVVFDAAEPEKLAQFWALALGYVTQPLPEGFTSLEEFFRSIGIPEEEFGDQWALIDPAGNGPRLYFQRVPEGKTAKNRVHLDVRVAGPDVTSEERERLISEHVLRLVAAGGTVAWELDEASLHGHARPGRERVLHCLGTPRRRVHTDRHSVFAGNVDVCKTAHRQQRPGCDWQSSCNESPTCKS
ncbi:MAG TPA: VOC family protein [Streptosporangiaceae bacterium]